MLTSTFELKHNTTPRNSKMSMRGLLLVFSEYPFLYCNPCGEDVKLFRNDFQLTVVGSQIHETPCRF